MISRKLLTGLAAVLSVALGATAEADDFDRRYLAVDQSLHGNLSNAQMIMGQATDHQKLWDAGEEAWESANDIDLGYVGSIVEGHDGVYRMYYEGRMPGGQHFGAIATSTDGLNWTKPAMNLRPDLVDHADSNLISLDPGGHDAMDDGKWYEVPVVYYDANAPTSERYKMAWIGSRPAGGSAGYIATSSDGLNFTTHHAPNDPAWKHKADANHSLFYDEINDEWAMYGRIRGAPWTHSPGWTDGDTDRRGIPRHSDADWDSEWDNVGQQVVDPMDIWTYETHPNSINHGYPEGSGPDLYGPNVQMYHGQFIGLPTAFYRDPSRVVDDGDEVDLPGPLYPIVMHSHDGVNWDVPDSEHPIIDPTPHLRFNPAPGGTNPDELEVGQLHNAATMLEVGDELLVYYLHNNATHYEPYAGAPPKSCHVAKMRADGFASIRADAGEVGQWHTPTLSVPEGTKGLVVNADVAGQLQVEVLDSGGSTLSGFSLAESVPFSGDEISALMTWSGSQFGDLAGQDVQLRFSIDDGEIYSFSWSQVPEPTGLCLLSLGGLMGLALRRRRDWQQEKSVP